uniref:uncharacterized protein LOC125906551 n=1 Tax=Anopheles coluzzii TaxID=1518534 RepID=UPI0020FFE67B|nr:uncharacterized protein LOC125906551 [Anopheles coluzzii]
MRCLLLSFTCLALTSAVQKDLVLFDLMKWQQLKVVYVFHCFHLQDELIHQLHSARKNHPASMSFLNVASFSGSKFEASLQSVHVGVGLMADLNCDGLAGVLKALSVRGFFNGARFRWLLGGLETLQQSRMILEKLNITASSMVLLTLPMRTSNNDTNFAILDVCGHRVGTRWELSFLQIGAWSTSAGLTMWDKRSVYERRQNLLGMQLTGIAKASVWTSARIS